MASERTGSSSSPASPFLAASEGSGSGRCSPSNFSRASAGPARHGAPLAWGVPALAFTLALCLWAAYSSSKLEGLGHHVRLDFTGDPSTVDVQKRGQCFWLPGMAADQQLQRALQRCIGGRSIFLFGNSIARHWYFALVELLSSDSVRRLPHDEAYRQGEKLLCGHDKLPGGCSSHNVSFWWNNDPFFDPATVSAMRRSAPDVVIGNAGLGAIYHHCEDWHRLVLNETEAWARELGALPPRVSVFWRTTTKVCGQFADEGSTAGTLCRDGEGMPYDANSKIVMANLATADILRRRLPRATLIDGFNLTRNCEGYDDDAHHATETVDHILVTFAHECPWLVPTIARVCPHLCHFLQGV